jgi:diguanylate cyclase (GGDEF)-like protein
VTKDVRCPSCGEAAVAVCASCGYAFVDAIPALDGDSTASDDDQTTSDQDQTWSDHDQTASDRDQRSAEQDQHAADDDFAAGGDPSAYQRGVRARERTAGDRYVVATLRDETASARLRTADDRDRAADLRDRGAAGRDELARLHDLDDDTYASREDVLLRAERDRSRAAADRAKAADDRKRAAADRARAARERAEARDNQAAAAEALSHATTDELTGAWTRRFGLEQVFRELERAHRIGTTLVLAFVDVDGLKEVNDGQGHLAGDALLRVLGEQLRANIRSYDVLVRYGGDELVCAMPNLTTAEAAPRFARIAETMASRDGGHSVTFGLAEAQPADTLEDLIMRADNALLAARHSAAS